MADVPLPQDVRSGSAAAPGSQGDRRPAPEDFEDAGKVDAADHPRGITFKAQLDLVEAMGAEFYAHFGIHGRALQAEELQELRDDAGGVEELTDGDHVLVARLSPQSRARTGEQAELWLDATKLHFFGDQSGDPLT